MNREELVAWIEACLDAAKQGLLVEDSFVELKAEFPKDHDRAARQIAGHANSARGSRLLWIVGVREDGTVDGARKHELADWWHGIRRRFDGSSPNLTRSISIRLGKKNVVGLLFTTNDPPYLVNCSDGRRVVPWRDCNSTRCASKEELRGLLREFAHQPDVDLLHSDFSLYRVPRKGWNCWFKAKLYVKPRLRSRIIIPYHEAGVWVEILGRGPRTKLDRFTLSEHEGAYYDLHQRADYVIRNPSVLHVSSCGLVTGKTFRTADVAVEIILRHVNCLRPIRVPVKFSVSGRRVQETSRVETDWLDDLCLD